MKLNSDIEKNQLIKYGFEKIDKAEEEENYNYTLSSMDYKLELGKGRRGQYYYILIDWERKGVQIWSSAPDGEGAPTVIPNVLGKLIIDGIIVFD